MGGSKGGDQTIGYKYYLGIDFAWCHAPVDRCTGLFLDNREIYRGSFEDQQTIYISKPELFGEFEGGIRGYVDLENGAEDQTPNTYTVSQTGSDTPAYRGVTRTIFRGPSSSGNSRAMYVGNNPYLKKITGEFQRIYKRIQDGQVTDQWQSSIAGVPLIDPDDSQEGISGLLADQSIFINVDLSSASNGFSGDDGSIAGNGQSLATVKQSVIASLVDIRDNYLLETYGPVLGWLLDQLGDELPTGVDIGVGYVRFTDGAQDNTSNNPNSVSPFFAPVPGEKSSDYNLPQRGWIMKENATKNDINDIIEFVNEFVVVPDTLKDFEDRQLMSLFSDNVSEAFGSLTTDKLRALVTYSTFVTDETEDEILQQATAINNVLAVNSNDGEPVKTVHAPDVTQYNNSEYDARSITVGTEGEGSGTAMVSLVTPVGSLGDGTFEITSGGWYEIASATPPGPATGPIYNLIQDGAPFEVGDRTLVDNPAGAGGIELGKQFTIPATGRQTWAWGREFEGGIYDGNFDIETHWQRDAEDADKQTRISLLRKTSDTTAGFLEEWRPFKNPSDKFTSDNSYIGDDGGNAGVVILNAPDGYVEMNPAHIIRECLTDQQWGLGLSESEIDETSFASSALTLYIERFGLSIAWNRETPIEDFINVILNHIDAVLYVDRNDGLFHLVLIRDDYDPDTIPSYTDDDVVDWTNIGIKSPAELVNTVTVKFNSRELDGEASLTVHNLAQIQKLGKKIHTTVNYPGIWQETLATRVAQRDLITLSTSLIAGEVVLTREAYDLAPGDVFKLTSSRYNLSGEVMRVVEVNVGDGRQNSIRVKFTQDKFNFDYSTDTDLVNSPDSEWDDPTDGDPDTVEDRVVTEEPYYLFVSRNGEILANEIETQEQNIGYVFVSANPPTTKSMYARINYDTGIGYRTGAQVPYGPYATLGTELVEEADDTTLTFGTSKNLEDVEVNDLIQIQDEIMRVDSIDSETQFTISRGALDTVPDYHTSGLPIFFISSSNGIVDAELVSGDSVDIKLLDSTTGDTLDPALSLVDTVVMDDRITKPYPVGQLQLDGAYSGVWDTSTGTIEATWVHRDRTLQNTTAPPVHVDSSVGPETDNNYTISAVAYDLFGDEITSIGDLFSVDKNQDTSHTITPSSYTPTSEGTSQWSAVGVRVKTTREESTSEQYDNWQTPEVIAFWPLEPTEINFYSGAWVDVNQLSGVWQENTKDTNVASDGDPIGYMENVRGKY